MYGTGTGSHSVIVNEVADVHRDRRPYSVLLFYNGESRKNNIYFVSGRDECLYNYAGKIIHKMLT